MSANLPRHPSPLRRMHAGQRRGAAIALAACVLGAHLWLLGSRPPAPGLQGQPSAAVSMHVRQIMAAATPAAPPAVMHEAAAAAAAIAATARAAGLGPGLDSAPLQAQQMRRQARGAAPSNAASGGPEEAGRVAAAAVAGAAAVGAEPRSAAVGADSASESSGPGPVQPPAPAPGADRVRVPVYSTQPAPAATLVYQLQRGGSSGTARLVWQPTEAGYSLNLAVDGGELRGLGAGSRGSFDAAGLAPERAVDRRRGRDVRAANFQREHGSVSFSATPNAAALQDGMQDRLSWMLQLPAVLQANPALREDGAEVSLWVAGGRGHTGVWTFQVVGSTPLALPGAAADVATLYLRRSPAQPYDTQVDVWLDPARHHLPVRVRMSAPPGAWANELQLTDLVWAGR